MVIGQAPPPCDDFTLITVGEKRAAMFGGWTGIRSDDLFFVEFSRQSVVSLHASLRMAIYKSMLQYHN